MARKPDFIMTAGPVQASDRVRAALGGQIIFDYSEPFFELYRDTERRLKTLFKTENDIVMMQGEALLGLEAVSVCGLDEGDVVINIESGHYGEGNRYFIEKYGGKAVPVETEWNTVVQPEQLEAVLKANPEAKILWIVHCETPCGTISDLETLVKLGKRHGCLVFVDAVSSLGSRDIRTDEWGIDVMSVGSQKVLGAPPGLSAMSVSEAAWEKFRSVRNPNRHSYFSILDWKEKWIEGGFWPYTPSTTDVAGLNAAVSEYLEVGHEEHFRRYAEVARAARAGVRAMGLEIWPDKDENACEVVTAVTVPAGIDDKELRGRMLERFGVLISGSLINTPIFGKLVRIGHMGGCCDPSYAVLALAAMEHSLKEMGHPVTLGSGVAGALAAL
ncbi:MAG: alanine--glyoxylate aminotransferase family protein [Actinobacteria bacterium]|nr:alanine--glyoxylate aminotransferase family protein [Actinomycetota bacterium]